MFKTAWRTSIRHKQFSLLNILGLSIGITTCLLIGLYVQDELSYDNFHTQKDRIFRINQSFIWGNWDEQSSTTGPNVAIALRTDIPEFEQVTKVLATEPFSVAYREGASQSISFLEDKMLAVEGNFFDIFSFEAIQGDLGSALKDPFKVVITEKTATKYFGEDDALGKVLHLRGTILEGNQEKAQPWQPYEVTAVVKNPPQNSHMQFELLTSMSSHSDVKQNESTWVWTGFVTYGLVKEGTDMEALNTKLQTVPPRWAASTLQIVFGQTFEELEAEGKSWNLYPEPIEDVYLHAEIGNLLGTVGSTKYIMIFSAIGLIILALSCINFMNLSTARSANRAKEVGIRKVLGSQRKVLIKQFIFESILFTLASTLIAIVATELLLNAFNQIAQKELSLYAQLANPVIVGGLFLFVILLGLLSGTYPAFYLSSFKPVEILKGKISSGFRGKGLRNALVVFQFTASIALITSTFFVHRQLRFTNSFDVGYDRELVLQLHNIERHGTEVTTLKSTLLSNPYILTAGQSHEVPPNIRRGDIIDLDNGNGDEIEVKRMKTDSEYLELLSPKWLAGRNFDPSRTLDISSGVILNASAVKALGLGNIKDPTVESPIGQQIARGNDRFNIIGVVEDFNFNSLKQEVMPLVIYHIENPNLPDSGTSPSYLSLRLARGVITSGIGLKSLIETVEGDIKRLDPDFPFEYSFMDQNFENSFRSEQRMAKVLNIFTAMAIVIACLGLFGLAAFSAEQRKKELGVRKVLGAKVIDLVVSFSSEFTKFVLISIIIAIPIAYYFVQSWLNGFAYKTPISIWVFVLAAISALAISWGTVGFQSLKSARLNPVEALKEE